MDTFSYLLGKKSSGGGDIDWTAIGFNGTPQAIIDGYDYAVQLKENWNESFTNQDRKMIIFPLVDTSNITSLNMSFYADSSLITIAPINTSNVTNMNNMFESCSALKLIPLLDTSNVTTMNKMFHDCIGLEEIPLLNVSKVTSMTNMFEGCKSLKTIPLLDTSNVTDMGSMLKGCSNLTTFPLLQTPKVTNFYNMFASGSTKLDNTSLDNILKMCISATSYVGTKTLKQLGFTSSMYSASKIAGLPSYQDFLTAGWTIGY